MFRAIASLTLLSQSLGACAAPTATVADVGETPPNFLVVGEGLYRATRTGWDD